MKYMKGIRNNRTKRKERIKNKNESLARMETDFKNP